MSYLWVVLPVGLLITLALARLARLRPSFRPLVGPFAFSILALGAWVLVLEGRLAASNWVLLLILIPLLMFFVRAIGLAFDALFRHRQGAAPPALLDSLIAVLLYGLGAALVANRWFGIELTLFLGTSAVVGAVVGLALQDSLGNLFAGIALHTEAPFRVGDWVRVGDRDGKVEQISWRATRLRTWDGDTLTVPNNDVARHGILNYSLPKAPHSRVLTIGVSYHTPPNKVVSVLEGMLAQVQGLVPDPAPGVRVVHYDDSAIRYEVRYWIPAYEDYRRMESEIHRLTWYHFRRHGIEIPFPSRNVYLHQAGATEGAESPTTRLQRALRGVDLFRPLSDDELRAAAARFRPLHYAGGEKIIEEGAPGNSFFLIDNGEVQVSKKMGGFSRELARLMEGQFFGEMALLTGEPRAATVVAASDVDVFVLDKNGFQDIIAANPAIAVDMSGILAERREALSQAEEDVTHRFDVRGNPAELKQRILDRIRSYFGV
ncbi:MAG TPA: mechanosensitive ion channel family protein [Vicinamibacteria bacterium]